MKKSCLAFLAASLLFSTINLPMHPNKPSGDDGSYRIQPALVAAGGAFVIAGGILCGFLLKKLFAEPSNDQLSKEAQEVYKAINGIYQESNIAKLVKNGSIESMSLYELVHLKQVHDNGYYRDDITALNYHELKLTNRVQRDGHKAGNGPDFWAIRDRVLPQISALLKELCLIDGISSKHRPFFDLYDVVAHYAPYQQLDYHNRDMVRMYIKGEVGGTYPFTRYVQQLRRDISELDGKLLNLSKVASYTQSNQDYMMLGSQAQALVLHMRYLRDVIVDMPEIAYEEQQKKADDYYKEQQRIEREKAEAAQREADAKQKIAQEEARKNQIEREKIAAKLKEKELELKTADTLKEMEQSKLERLEKERKKEMDDLRFTIKSLKAHISSEIDADKIPALQDKLRLAKLRFKQLKNQK